MNYTGGEVSSVRITGDESDRSLYVAYFKSEDCAPDTIIRQVDQFECDQPNCIDVSYQSFQVYDVCENGKSCVD
jgi:hypothetical protein